MVFLRPTKKKTDHRRRWSLEKKGGGVSSRQPWDILERPPSPWPLLSPHRKKLLAPCAQNISVKPSALTPSNIHPLNGNEKPQHEKEERKKEELLSISKGAAVGRRDIQFGKFVLP